MSLVPYKFEPTTKVRSIGLYYFSSNRQFTTSYKSYTNETSLIWPLVLYIDISPQGPTTNGESESSRPYVRCTLIQGAFVLPEDYAIERNIILIFQVDHSFVFCFCIQSIKIIKWTHLSPWREFQFLQESRASTTKIEIYGA